MEKSNFHTFSEYMKKDDSTLTASMEDYIEMLYRLSAASGFTRIHELSQALNIKPPSATKMVQKLASMGYLKYERYGALILQERGKQIGAWLYKRHAMLESFMRIIGVDDAVILQETEKIEHTLSNETTACLDSFVTFLINDQTVVTRYSAYRAALTDMNDA